ATRVELVAEAARRRVLPVRDARGQRAGHEKQRRGERAATPEGAQLPAVSLESLKLLRVDDDGCSPVDWSHGPDDAREVTTPAIGTTPHPRAERAFPPRCYPASTANAIEMSITMASAVKRQSTEPRWFSRSNSRVSAASHRSQLWRPMARHCPR